MIKAIITGATGMVGEGVLHECIKHPDIESILVITRKPTGVNDPKVTELIHTDFSDFSSLEEELRGYNAAYLCMGTTSFLSSEKSYSYVTYDLTMALARPLVALNPDITLCYVSGAGTDASEAGRLMWTRVKGKTENDLLKLPAKQAFMFRAGIITPTRGLKNTYTFYKILNPILPVVRKLFPGMISSLEEIGLAMIQATKEGYEKPILEVADIVALAAQEGKNLHE
ncbi:MAG: NAD-dependent epimerase/dehydratase family protein [Candidatus Marinimicrobia bacterium]|nr:NAD-dependent epimerase/dehydratase family protein [Candidatus Neomarinimicrobiota bacterium]MCF7850258.1 NAD-dependent epimerase/dehydratase family protein [Candidatus Neomarinimicrobiota bacterium]MCF7903845.1 NAD-dependent epimerase/dehydratase family protein [Candidatus Neomarinimicrobiota bacterium]